MSDVTLSPSTIVLVGTLVSGLVTAIVALYRQALKDRDKLLDEAYRERDESKIRVIALEGLVQQQQSLSNDAVAVARLAAERWLAEEGRTRMS
jgi:hypothetical protein